MTRYTPSRSYLTASLVAIGLGAASTVFAYDWLPALIAVGLFILSALLLLVVALRPAIEVHADALLIGRRRIPWSEIRRVDRTGWISPLVVHLTLADETRVVVFHPGNLDTSNALLRQLREFAHLASIDGIPYRQFWGEEAEPPDSVEEEAPWEPLLRPEDEAEVERLYRRLKKVGRLDSSHSEDEK